MNEPEWTFRFFVPGIPQPQPRVKFANLGKFSRAYTPCGAWSAWKRAIEQDCRPAPAKPHDGPVDMDIEYRMPKPKALAKKLVDGMLCWRKPDMDNMEKLVLDALKNAGWFYDDGRVASVSHRKVYHDQPGVFISITLLDEGAFPE